MSDNIYEARQRVEDAQTHLRQRRRDAFPEIKAGLVAIFGLAAVVPSNMCRAAFATVAAGLIVKSVWDYYSSDRCREDVPVSIIKQGGSATLLSLAAIVPSEMWKVVFGTAAAGVAAWAMKGYYKSDSWGISDYRLVKMAKNILADAESDLRRLEEKENGGVSPADVKVKSEFFSSPLP